MGIHEVSSWPKYTAAAMMMAPPAMVEMAPAICAPPRVSSLMASPRLTAPQTTTKPPRKVMHPETRLMMFDSRWIPFCRVPPASGSCLRCARF